MEYVSKSGRGCKLGVYASNIIAYADDLIILAPSLSALQDILNICCNYSVSLSLKFNTSKCYCMKFMKSLSPLIDCNFIKINGQTLQFVNEIKYLGFNLKFNMSSELDIIEQRNKFYNTFNMILRKFYNVDEFIFLRLFKTYCCQFYGLELWFGPYKCITNLKKFAVGYHRAVKKIFKVPDRESNHLVCELAGILTFDHYSNWNKIKFVYKIFKEPPDFIDKNFNFMFLNSKLLNEVSAILDNVYQVHDLLSNDIDALRSRVFYIHNSYNDYLF